MLVLGAGASATPGAVSLCWCCELAVHVVETGCWHRCWCWAQGAGAGGAGCRARAVSWLRAWWRHGAGVGWVPLLVLVL